VPEKKFYLKADAPIQEIGMRAQIVSFLIANGVKEGNVVNDPDDKRKVIVAVRADDEKKIEQVKNDLVSHLRKLNKNDLCYSEFPSELTASELQELNNPHSLPVISLGDLASSLMLEQTSKGVGAMKFLAKTLEPLKELPSAIKELASKISSKL
jgi:hypothetical protein